MPKRKSKSNQVVLYVLALIKVPFVYSFRSARNSHGKYLLQRAVSKVTAIMD
jgi:hypothetical protein